MNFKQLFCLSLLVSIIGCSETTDCNCLKKNEVLVQEINTKKIYTRLTRTDHGASGYSMNLKVCDTSDMLLEKIELRGEDNLPTVDSIAGNTIFVHYSFPSHYNADEIERELKLESVALGDALLDSSSLKFNYIFKNKN